MAKRHKRKLRVFDITVLRRICRITREDRRMSLDVLKELLMEADIVEMLQTY